jgi:uncharacterized protein with PIN domain
VLELWFRFYGQLNDFLPAAYRRGRFRHVIQTPASVKDVIEALGVPHPEVDILIVNGEPRDFTCRLQNGDRISVYPPFRSVDVAGVRRAGSDPPDPRRFAVDIHVRKLASRLRLAGFDSVVLTDDAELAQVAASEERILLTRDVGLLKRGMVRHGYWVRHTDPELQLAEVVEHFDLLGRMHPFTRCIRCNTVLQSRAKASVEKLVPAYVFSTQEKFFWCATCRRVYWPATHHQNMVDELEKLQVG